MTQIFKIKVKNKDLADALPELHFETQEAAEAVMNTFNQMTRKGKKIKWECSIVDVLNKQDAFEQFMAIAETLPKE